jgi:hypothetical protein
VGEGGVFDGNFARQQLFLSCTFRTSRGHFQLFPSGLRRSCWPFP